ncbi:MAG: DUF4886 domain-containing protein [Planctomycetota bacterium]
MASDLGIDIDVGYHVRCGSSATQIVDDPATTCVDPTDFGDFQTALPGYGWDAITIQSHAAGGATLESETNAIAQLATLAKQNSGSADTSLYLYQAWFFNNNSQESNWLSPVESSFQQPTVHRRAYFSRLRDELSGLGHDFSVVPTGDVLYRVLEEIRSGNLPGLTSREDLFRDSIHMSYGVGRFLASTTVLATVLQIDPTGYDSPWNLDRDLETRLQSLVWEVVSNHPEAGIVDGSVPGDYSDDGEVGFEDVYAWQSSFGSSTNFTADGNRDFLTGADDYSLLRDSITGAGFPALGGDFNKDGVVDFDDQRLWESQFGSTTDFRGDGNGDFDTNSADYTVWRDGLTAGSGYLPYRSTDPISDFNNDGVVSLADYEFWQTHFGSTNNLAADVNGDLQTEVGDYAVWRDTVTPEETSAAVVATVTAASVPEPTGIAIALLTVACRLTQRR